MFVFDSIFYLISKVLNKVSERVPAYCAFAQFVPPRANAKRCAPAEAMEVASSAIEIFFYRLQISKGVFKKYLLMRFMLQHAA